MASLGWDLLLKIEECVMVTGILGGVGGGGRSKVKLDVGHDGHHFFWGGESRNYRTVTGNRDGIWGIPFPSNSHHQDYSIFSREPL